MQYIDKSYSQNVYNNNHHCFDESVVKILLNIYKHGCANKYLNMVFIIWRMNNVYRYNKQFDRTSVRRSTFSRIKKQQPLIGMFWVLVRSFYVVSFMHTARQLPFTNVLVLSFTGFFNTVCYEYKCTILHLTNAKLFKILINLKGQISNF